MVGVHFWPEYSPLMVWTNQYKEFRHDFTLRSRNKTKQIIYEKGGKTDEKEK